MNRRGFLAGLFAAPLAASLPDILRPSLFGRVAVGAMRRRMLIDEWSADLADRLATVRPVGILILTDGTVIGEFENGQRYAVSPNPFLVEARRLADKCAGRTS